MGLSLLVFRYYFLSWLTNIFITKPLNKKQFAARNLFQSTFRIPQSERTSTFLVLKYFLQTFKLLFYKNSNNDSFLIEPSNNKPSIFIYDNNKSEYDSRKKFIEYFTKEIITGGIFKNNLHFIESKLNFIFFFILNTIWAPFLFIHSILKKDKAPIANFFKEQIECINMIALLKKNNVNKIYHFSIYEKDSNLNTLLLQKQKIKVYKIPSEVPLGVWNKTIIADKLCLCMGYQYDELNAFKDSIFVNEVAMFGPENCLQNIEKYKHSIVIEKSTIGFYSTGAWIRKLEDHNNQGYDMEEKEEEVKSIIRDFCRQNSNYKLLVFLHPREKWDKYHQQTKERYEKFFKGINYKLSDKNINSSLSFEKVSIGVAFQSTIVYERLYYGFKTITMPINSHSFPVENSNMKNICCYNHEQLFNLLNKSINQTNKEFFESNKIIHYANYLHN